MTRTVYLDGAFLPEQDARVSIFDRGFLMSDAVYEVTAVLAGKPVDLDRHLLRLQQSLAAIDVQQPPEWESFPAIHRDLILRNGLEDGLVYLQITRGNPGDRDFLFDMAPTRRPTVVMFTQSKPGLAEGAAAMAGIRVMLLPDLRWHRRDIKTTQLLYPSIAKTTARRAGVDDAWLVENGYVTEGTASNAAIIRGRTLITRPATTDILNGITRRGILALSQEAGLELAERPFTPEEAQSADEAFQTSAAGFVTPVIQIGDRSIGEGQPGPMTRRLRALCLSLARKGGG